MGRAGSAVEVPEKRDAAPPGYKSLDGEVPVIYAPQLEDEAGEVQGYLAEGYAALSGMLSVEPPGIYALLVADEDWRDAPREYAGPYPPGLPYFTRSTEPPALVLPAELSPVFRPRTAATMPLAVWHEMAHAFLLSREVVWAPAWLREFVPQAASAALARRLGLPLEDHLSRIDGQPGFTVRRFRVPAVAEAQMSFQNLLLLLGVAALERFGEDFLLRIVHALWQEADVVEEDRAEELLAGALGPGGREWLASRPEF